MILQPALESLKQLQQDHAGTVDIIFIDADKVNYPNYYEEGLKLLRQGGIIVVDNVLWAGYVIDENDQSESTQAIRKINDIIYNDDRVEVCMIPTSDGVTIAYKK